MFIEAVLLAIVLAPTDAALGQAVVTDPRVPSRVRQGLNVESGLNDGICVPLLLIAIAIAEAEEGAIGGGAAFQLVLEEIGYGCVGGVVAGLAAAAVLRVGVPRGLVDPMWVQVVPVAGAAFAYGLAVWLHGSGFIAAFVGGAVFGGLRREAGGEVTLFLEETGNLLGAATFVLFGAVMLVPVLDDLSAEVVLYALLSLTLIRMVPVGLAMLRSGARRPTVAFLGWFGPRGLASIVFAVILVEDADLANESLLLNTIFLTIGLSVLLHGLTAAPLAGRYAAWFAATPARRRPRIRECACSRAAPARLGGWAGGRTRRVRRPLRPRRAPSRRRPGPGAAMNLLLAVVILAGAVAVAIGAMLFVRRTAPEGSYFEDGDRASGVFGVLATGFAIFAGFVIFLAFTSYDQSRSGAEAEALVVVQQFQTAQFMPVNVRDRLTGQLVCYGRSVVGEEWPSMQDGTAGASINPWAVALFSSLKLAKPRTSVEDAAYGKWLDQTSDREEGRRDRVHGAAGIIPDSIWLVLLFTAVIVFAFMLFFADSAERAVSQAMLIGSATAVVTATLLAIHVLDNPYRPGVGSLKPVAMERSLVILDEARDVLNDTAPLPCDEEGAPS